MFLGHYRGKLRVLSDASQSVVFWELLQRDLDSPLSHQGLWPHHTCTCQLTHPEIQSCWKILQLFLVCDDTGELLSDLVGSKPSNSERTLRQFFHEPVVWGRHPGWVLWMGLDLRHCFL